ncbi:Hypothetical predicted protein [Lecanosticta acicola]|uniref:Uncharacterized protein n=1 Tax=Lecanosticta acicola TaxID=111012 RepID=A0AAI9E7N1_9PEZI|nr:Hypothetical predicted protein [Lecanosticta acicola]
MEQRRSSFSHPLTNIDATPVVLRRTSSMTQAARVKGRLKVPAFIALKASPASPAFTACSIHIAESPRLNTVYESPAERFRPVERRASRQFAHTVQSDHGTYQMLWDDPDPSTASSIVTLLVDPGLNVIVTDDWSSLRHNEPHDGIPLGEVRTKLAIWNWEREIADDASDESSRSLPLLPLNDAEQQQRKWLSDHSPGIEDPPAPPNTGRSSARHSGQYTPAAEESEEEESEDSPIELNVRAVLAEKPHHSTQPTPRATTPSNDYLSVPRHRSSLPASPSINRDLWSLPSEDIKFRSHRDSVEITAGYIRRREMEGKINQELMTGHKDSFILTKDKFASKYATKMPASTHVTVPWNRRFGGALSPILDMSPPSSNSGGLWASLGETARLPEPAMQVPEVEARDDERYHPDEHQNCPICEEHRPRWFEANCRGGRLGFKE